MIVIIIIIIDDDNRRRPHLSGDVGVDHVDLLGEVDDAPAPSSSPAAYYHARFGKLPLRILVDCFDAFRQIALSHVLFVDSLGEVDGPPASSLSPAANGCCRCKSQIHAILIIAKTAPDNDALALCQTGARPDTGPQNPGKSQAAAIKAPAGNNFYSFFYSSSIASRFPYLSSRPGKSQAAAPAIGPPPRARLWASGAGDGAAFFGYRREAEAPITDV